MHETYEINTNLFQLFVNNYQKHGAFQRLITFQKTRLSTARAHWMAPRVLRVIQNGHEHVFMRISDMLETAHRHQILKAKIETLSKLNDKGVLPYCAGV